MDLERFSTRLRPPEAKLDFLNGVLNETFGGLVLDPYHRVFEAEVARLKMGDLTMMWPNCPGATISRNDGLAKRAPTQSIVLHILHSGCCRLTQRGRTTAMSPGDMVLTAGEEPYRFDCEDRHQVLVVDIPRARLADRLADVDDRIAIRVPGHATSTRLLRDFILSLWRESATDPGHEEIARYADILLEVILASLRARPDVAAEDHRAVHRLLDRARALVEAHLADPGFSPRALAQELGVSLRTLQSAMACTGSTPGAYINARRLNLAAQRLVIDRAVPISEVAWDCGFGDSAYFARRFGERFGTSPSAYRACH